MNVLGNLRIGMDGRMLTPGGTGVSTYARGLREAQRSISGGALILDATPAASNGLRGSTARVARALFPFGRRTRRHGSGLLHGHDIFKLAQVFFSIHARPLPIHIAGPAGLMHWTYPVPLYVPGWHNIYTVHDVIPLSDPGLTPIEPKRYRRILRSILARASAIVTVSDASCRQIAEHLGPLPVRVVNCRQAIDVSVDVQDALPGGLQDGQYMLVCGSVEPRKNIARLISAYRASGIAMPLVLAGPDGWRADMLSAQLGDTPGIVRLPSSTRAQMMTLIRHARALLMPSLAEGFGLPVAEAMALGTAVLTSARGALAETAGTAALLVEPESEEAISTGIRRLAHDEELVSDLAAQGRQRALALGLSEFASRLARLYADVVADAPHLTYRPPSWNEEQACGASQ